MTNWQETTDHLTRCDHTEPGYVCTRKADHGGPHNLEHAYLYDPDFPEAYITRFGGDEAEELRRLLTSGNDFNYGGYRFTVDQAENPSPFCTCLHPQPWHSTGVGPCRYPGGSVIAEGCGCEQFERHPGAAENVTYTSDPRDNLSWEREVIADYEKAKAAKKPMRIRYMELPAETNPETDQVTTPFVIVLDRIQAEVLAKLEDSTRKEALADAWKEATGARGVLTFPSEVQIGEDY